MPKEKIGQISLEELGRLGIGEETGDLYLDGEKLCFSKDVEELKEKFNALVVALGASGAIQPSLISTALGLQSAPAPKV